MPKAIRVQDYGGPEVMRYEDVPLPEPGPGEVRIRHTAIGVNFIDIYFRTGAYRRRSCPSRPAPRAPAVEAVGEGVTDFRSATGSPRSAREAPTPRRAIAARAAVQLPDGIDDATAAAMMLNGMTASTCCAGPTR